MSLAILPVQLHCQGADLLSLVQRNNLALSLDVYCIHMYVYVYFAHTCVCVCIFVCVCVCVVLGIKYRVLHVPDKHFTTEPHSQSINLFILTNPHLM